MTPDERIAELLAASEPHLVGVYPPLADKVREYIRTGVVKSLYFAAFMGVRTWPQQDDLWAQGRTKPGKKVTNAKGGESNHNFGLAVDMAEDGDPEKEGVQYSWAKVGDYLKLGSLAAAVGLAWGGLWKAFKDYPHVELTGGLTLAECRALYAQGGNQAVWAEVDKRLGIVR